MAVPLPLLRHLVTLLDLTKLDDDTSAADVERLCQAAATPLGKVAAVCIPPEYVGLAARLLAGSGIKVATVANFPGGGQMIDTVVAEVRQAVAAGADEIDLVLPYRALLLDQPEQADAMVRAVRAACAGKVLKVILETGELHSPTRIRLASELALAAGADMLKTSTGKVKVGATAEAARVMLQTIASKGGKAGIKYSGGVRSVEQALEYLNLTAEQWPERPLYSSAIRIGASALIADILRRAPVEQLKRGS